MNGLKRTANFRKPQHVSTASLHCPDKLHVLFMPCVHSGERESNSSSENQSSKTVKSQRGLGKIKKKISSSRTGGGGNNCGLMRGHKGSMLPSNGHDFFGIFPLTWHILMVVKVIGILFTLRRIRIIIIISLLRSNLHHFVICTQSGFQTILNKQTKSGFLYFIFRLNSGENL